MIFIIDVLRRTLLRGSPMLNLPLPKSGALIKSEYINVDMLTESPIAVQPDETSSMFERLLDQTSELQERAGEIIVRPFEASYEIIAGLEFYKALRKSCPRTLDVLCDVYHYSNEEVSYVVTTNAEKHYELSQLTVAKLYAEIMRQYQFSVTQLSEAIGISRPTVSNRIALLNLVPKVQKLFESGAINFESAKMLCRLAEDEQLKFAKEAVNKSLGTRELYKIINPGYRPKHQNAVPKKESLSDFVIDDREKDVHTLALQEGLNNQLKCPTSINLNESTKYKGVIELQFFGLGELEGILERITRLPSSDNIWKGKIRLTVDGVDHITDLMKVLLDDDLR